MVEEWNKNMGEQFTPSWVLCLNESMSPWMNKYTCPGWMFVPRKPHPFGNEYHSVCCSMSGTMWGKELVEGKDAPCAEAHPKPKCWTVVVDLGTNFWEGVCCCDG